MTARNAMLCPKPKAKTFVPALRQPDLETLIGDLAPDERKALDFIAQHGDLIEVEDAEPFLLVPTFPKLLDILAAVGAELDDRENDLEDEPDNDNEEDDPHGDLGET